MSDATKDPAKNMHVITDYFTPEEIEKAAVIFTNYKRSEASRSLNALLVERVVNAALPRINQTTGQENDASYMAYLLEYVLGVALSRVPPQPKTEQG